MKTNLDIPLKKLPDIQNIAEYLEDEDLATIATRVIEDYEADNQSRAHWLERYNRYLKQAVQVQEIKNFPFAGASNVKYPLTTTACLQFHARAYPMLVPSKNLVMTRVLGEDSDGEKQDRAERVQLHMNYQLKEQMKDWEEGHDKLLLTLPLTGCEFKKVYYDSGKDVNVAEHVLARDLVVHYYAKSLEDASRKTQVLELSTNKLLSLVREGLFLDCYFDEDDIGTPIQDASIKEAQDERQGIKEPKKDSDTPHMLLEWHGFLDLDGDGYREPYIVTVHKDKHKVLRIVARFQPDAVRSNAQGEVIEIEPDEYFVQYNFIPSPDGGIYGIGFGTLVGPLNDAVDTLINQLIDAGKQANLQAGFISKHFRLRAGDLKFKLGEWKQVNVSGQDIQSGIFPLPTKEPSGTLFELAKFLINAGERLTSTTDMMVGENPGQNQKATTTQAVLDQGQKVFTAIYKRIRNTMTKEFMTFYKLNSIYLDEAEYYDFLDASDLNINGAAILREDYQKGGFVLKPTADPNAVTQLQKVEKAQFVLQLVPMGTIDPKAATKRALEAAEIDHIAELIPEQTGPTPQEQMAIRQFQRDEETHQVDTAVKLDEQRRKNIETEIHAKEVGADVVHKAAQMEMDSMGMGLDATQKARESSIKEKQVKAKEAKPKAK